MAEIGENIRYLMRDCTGRPVGCALFGSAAWKCAARDAWIGWARAPTGSKPRFPDEQHALFGVALGDGTAFGQPPACDFGQTRSRRLAGQVWASSACAGNLCGSRSFQGNLLPGGQLVAARLDAGTHPQRSQPLPPRYGQGRVSRPAEPSLGWGFCSSRLFPSASQRARE